jgi:hypothetical protein
MAEKNRNVPGVPCMALRRLVDRGDALQVDEGAPGASGMKGAAHEQHMSAARELKLPARTADGLWPLTQAN